MLPGTILRAQSGFYDVLTEDGRLTCRLRGRLKQKRIQTDLAVVGDKVTITRLTQETGVIETVEPRIRTLVRLAPTARGLYQQVLLANLDLILLVFSCTRPEPHLRMLDRFLIIAEKQKLPAAIVINKIDLLNLDQVQNTFGHYELLGYPVIYTSTATGEGIGELGKTIQGKLTAFTGPSGVGKSSLLNLIQPGLGLGIHDVSLMTGKGQHTTQVRELFPLPTGGFIADMPGIKALALWDIQPEELDGYFPEFRDLVRNCQFNNCSHKDEPGCAVRQAIMDGQIHPERYQSYLRLRFGD
jgi:ribosome biogenesis GTPase / thiamine phosphate phosphatase